MAVNLNRKVEIRRYWADVFSSLREAQQIAIAENPEFTLVWEHIRQFIDDCFVQTAQRHVIERWEAIIGISPLSSDTLNERRNRILYMMQITLPYTLRKLKHVYLAQIVGEGNYKVTLDYVACTIEVLINPAKKAQWDDVAQMLDTILPCNLALIMGYMGTPHDMIEKYTHDELSKFSHDQMRDELLNLNKQ